MLHVHLFPCLSDNYGFLLHDDVSGETVAVDTPEAAVILQEARRKGWLITQIWNTHWHPDHAGGNSAIKDETGCRIVASGEVERMSSVSRVVADGDTVQIGRHEAVVIDVGGHTSGHVAYHLPDAAIAFVGDSVFPLGCGRMFEGQAEQYWNSLRRIMDFPPATLLYCAHEYASANARFALHADPCNTDLAAYVAEIESLRERHQPTVPTSLARELATNPFLRADRPEIQERWGGTTPAETFAKLRAAKDSF